MSIKTVALTLCTALLVGVVTQASAGVTEAMKAERLQCKSTGGTWTPAHRGSGDLKAQKGTCTPASSSGARQSSSGAAEGK